MADKSTTSSLLEAIKNKLNKLDNKDNPSENPQDKNALNPTVASYNEDSKNYFNQNIGEQSMNNYNIDKTNIEADISSSLDKISEIDDNSLTKKNAEEIDLDIDEEIVNIKNLSEKISIESKIKEISQEIDSELNFEEFEEDIEVDLDLNEEASVSKDLTPNYQQIPLNKLPSEASDENISDENIDDKFLDPIDLELAKLEREYELKKQNANNSQNIQNNNQENILENDSASKSEEDFKKYLDSQLNEEIFDIKKDSSEENSLEEELNKEQPNKINEFKIDANQINIGANSNYLKGFSAAKNYLNARVNSTLDTTTQTTQQGFSTSNYLANNLAKDNLDNPEIKNYKIDTQDNSYKGFDANFSDNSTANINTEIADKNLALNNDFKTPINNQLSSPESLATPARNNQNLIKEEAIYEVSNSLKKLVEAKNLVQQVNNFMDDAILSKIAVSLLEPKLEKWLNENISNLVEDIVRKEIEKITQKK